MTTIEEITKLCFYQSNPCVHIHVHMLLTNKDTYLAALRSVCDSGTFATISQAIKARVIAALHITRQHKVLQQLLPHCEVVEILKALTFLDRQRRVKQLHKKIAAIEQAHPRVKDDSSKADDEGESTKRPRKRRKVDVFRKQLKELETVKDALHRDQACAAAHKSSAVHELIESASVSGALARKIRQWAKENLKTDFLEFVVLTMPVTPWKKMADMVHFRPSDFPLPYFLSYVHGEPLPEDSFAHALRDLVAETDTTKLAYQYRALATKHPQVYLAFKFLRTQPQLLRVREIAEDLARNIPLSTAIWYLEELADASSEIPAMVGHRLMAEDWSKQHSKATASFGKLLERVLTFQSRHWDSLAKNLMVAAEQRLKALQEVWSEQRNNGTAVVFGDASSSMQTAIQAATIMATMISVCFGAELSFFHHDFVASPHPRPSTVQETLEVCRTIRASGATSLAAVLWPYYKEKKKIDRIVLVTDEEENTSCNNMTFARMLRAYREEVHENVELIVICVDYGDRCFRQSLVDNGIEYKVIQIDGNRPDLTKFDAMLGQIALGGRKEAEKEEESEFVVV